MLVRCSALAIPLCFWFIAEIHAPMKAREDFETSIRFEEYTLPVIGEDPLAERSVHPDLEHISGWISSVGAAVAIFDFDGDGFANDYCLVDPRFNTVTVAPVPTTGSRFAPREISWTEREASPGSVAPMGCLPADVDADGREDLILYYWGRGPTIHLAAQEFTEQPLLLNNEIWHTNAAIVADIDGDGVLDLVFGNYFPEDVEIIGRNGVPRMQHSMSRAANAGRNRLFRGLTGGKFEDASYALNLAAANGWTLAIGAADLDGDQLPELYIANDFGRDHLLHNRSDQGRLVFARVTAKRRLTDPRSRVLGKDSFKGMGVDFGDINRDGVLDIYVSNIAEDYALMESHLLYIGTGEVGAFKTGDAPFEEESGSLGVARSAWGWDARFVDFDGDGWSEILQATGFLKGETDRWPELHEVAMGNDELLKFPWAWPRFSAGDDLSGDRADALFVRQKDGHWRDIGQAIGFTAGTVTRGIALGDVDGDGDIDALLARQWAPSVLLKNVSEPRGANAIIEMRYSFETGLDRAAHGASVLLRSIDGRGPKIAKQVPGGEGHSGKSAPILHFGLGAFPNDAELVVEVSWRDIAGHHTAIVPVTEGRQRIVLTAGKASAFTLTTSLEE